MQTQNEITQTQANFENYVLQMHPTQEALEQEAKVVLNLLQKNKTKADKEKTI